MTKKPNDLLMNYSRLIRIATIGAAILTLQLLASSVPQCVCNILAETVQTNRTTINFNINNNNNNNNINQHSSNNNNYDSYNRIISVKSSDAGLSSSSSGSSSSGTSGNSTIENDKQIPLVRLPSNTLLKYTAYKDVSILHFRVPPDTRTALFTFKAYEEPNSAFSK